MTRPSLPLFASLLALMAIGCDSIVGPSARPSPPAGPVSDKIEELPGSAGVDGKTWLVSFDQAKRLSRETGRPILTDFTGSDWCIWCIRLDDEVFAKPAFQSWAEKHVVLLKLDFPESTPIDPAVERQNSTLASAYGIEGFPTVLFLDGNGELLERSGYVRGGPSAWIASAEELLGDRLQSTTGTATDTAPADATSPATAPAAGI